MKDLITFIKKNSIGTYKEDVKLEKNTTYKVGGVASLFVYPKNTDKLIILLDKLNKEGIKHKVLGFGSNVIFSDKRYDGVIIKLDNFNDVKIKDTIIVAGAGVSLVKLSYKAQKEGLPYYKWNTDLMTLMIYQNGIDDTHEIPGLWGFMSRWLALTLKFEKDEKVQYYAKEFYEGRIHYTDKYYLDRTIYEHMYYGPAPYLYVIYEVCLRNRGEEMPSYIVLLRAFYLPGSAIHEKKPSENGLSLVDCTRNDAKKYLGIYMSEEEESRIREESDAKLKAWLAERQGCDSNS